MPGILAPEKDGDRGLPMRSVNRVHAVLALSPHAATLLLNVRFFRFQLTRPSEEQDPLLNAAGNLPLN